jgi:hypothetical protein
MTASANTNDLMMSSRLLARRFFVLERTRVLASVMIHARAARPRNAVNQLDKGEWKMEMTEFEKLLDSVDAAYIAHNDYFKANESNLDDQRLAEFEEQIDEAHDKVWAALKPLNDKLRRKLTDLAHDRAKTRWRKLRRWVDPKVIREDARRAAAEQKRSHKEFLDNHYLKRMSASERQQWERDRRHHQAEIDEKQDGKCAQCGEPLDADQQGLFRPPNMICDTCVIESMHPNNEGARVL